MHLEGNLLSKVSRPMAYDTETRQFEIYSEELSLAGYHTIQV